MNTPAPDPERELYLLTIRLKQQNQVCNPRQELLLMSLSAGNLFCTIFQVASYLKNKLK